MCYACNNLNKYRRNIVMQFLKEGVKKIQYYDKHIEFHRLDFLESLIELHFCDKTTPSVIALVILTRIEARIYMIERYKLNHF